jgi:hypothetical protein
MTAAGPTLSNIDVLWQRTREFSGVQLGGHCSGCRFSTPSVLIHFSGELERKVPANTQGGQYSTPTNKDGRVLETKPTYTPKVNAFQAAFQGNPNTVAQVANGVEQLHPKIKAFMTEYHKLYNGEVYMPQLMELANVRWSDLPCLDGHWNSKDKDRQCKTCWPHICWENVLLGTSAITSRDMYLEPICRIRMWMMC